MDSNGYKWYAPCVSKQYTFNSIEWIRVLVVLVSRIFPLVSFNSIEWILFLCFGHVGILRLSLLFQFHWMDSLLITRYYELLKDELLTFNSIEWIRGGFGGSTLTSHGSFQFHWMDSNMSTGLPMASTPSTLSIPLNGFSTWLTTGAG